MTARQHAYCLLLLIILALAPCPTLADLVLGAEQIVLAGGSQIQVPGYSVPSLMDWNGDNVKDLVVGQGSGTSAAKVRVYLNAGTPANPQFSDFFYAQYAAGGDLTCTGGGCLGLFPRATDWDGDAKQDLVVGQADGTIKLFTNCGPAGNPVFDDGILLETTYPESRTVIDVGARATSTIVDWNSDGKKDLAIGALDGKIHLFLNEGPDDDPIFYYQTFAQADGADLVVPGARSSPVVLDLDDDGRKDLLTGNTNGQLLFYANTGTDASPTFSQYSLVEADGVPIDLPGSPRSRPSVCDWNDDGLLDVLIGAADGKVHLYQGIPEPTTLSMLLLALPALMRATRRRTP